MQKDKAKSLLKLNLGCGLAAPDGWVNLDSSYNAFLAKCPKLRNFLKKFKILPSLQKSLGLKILISWISEKGFLIQIIQSSLFIHLI